MPAARDRPGYLGLQEYAALGSAEFEYRPRPGHSSLVVWTKPTTNGTVQLFRSATWGRQSIAAAVAVTAGNEDKQTVSHPIVGSLVVVFTDTSTGAGSVQCEASDAT